VIDPVNSAVNGEASVYSDVLFMRLVQKKMTSVPPISNDTEPSSSIGNAAEEFWEKI